MRRESKWLVALVDKLRVRPAMYLGSSDLGALAMYLAAFARGRDSVADDSSGRDEFRILLEFARWLAPAEPTARYLGWVGIVRDEAQRNSRVDALNFFFEKFSAFRNEVDLVSSSSLRFDGWFDES